MIKIAFIGYRKWGYEIIKILQKWSGGNTKFKIEIIITSPNSEFKDDGTIEKFYVVEGNDNEKIYKYLKKNHIDLVLCYSWSWIIKGPIISDFICLCLHPAPLPKYRGGTPIQHQIINGETKSAVTIFKMSAGIDDGPIYSQIPISFRGDIENIFKRMVKVGVSETKKIIKDMEKGSLILTPQKNLSKYRPLKRRKPEQSELTLDELEKMNFTEVENFVRALTGPYPHAFIQIGPKKLEVLKVIRSKRKKPDSTLEDNSKVENTRNYLIKVKDGYAKIVKSKISN